MAHLLHAQPPMRIAVAVLVGASQMLHILPTQTLLTWLPIGIAAGLLVRWGPSLWLPVMLGALAAQMATGHGLPGALLPGISLVSGPLCLAWYLARSGFRHDFSGRNDAVRFGLATAAAFALPPTINLLGMAWLGIASTIHDPMIRWMTWWSHATIGALLVGPVIITLSWAIPRGWLRDPGATLMPAASVALVLIASLMLPRGQAQTWLAPLGMVATVVIAMRTDLVLLSLFCLALATAVTQDMPDGGAAWFYSMTLAGTALLLHSLMAERQQAETSIRDHEVRHRLALLEAVSDEQQRVGREVHDTIGQELTSLSLMARSVANRALTVSPPLVEEAQEVLLACGQAVGSARVLSRDLVIRGAAPRLPG